MKHILTTSICAAALLFNPAALFAAQMVSEDGYEVHYSAFNSTFLEPEIAKENRLKRSRDEAVINITVVEASSVPAEQAAPSVVAANITGKAVNLAGQIKELAFRKITEGDTIYYISNVHFADQETLNFEIDVQPQGREDPEPIRLEFSQQFFVD